MKLCHLISSCLSNILMLLVLLFVEYQSLMLIADASIHADAAAEAVVAATGATVEDDDEICKPIEHR